MSGTDVAELESSTLFKMRTEQELRAAFVGDAKPSSGPFVVVDYDPEWPRL